MNAIQKELIDIIASVFPLGEYDFLTGQCDRSESLWAVVTVRRKAIEDKDLEKFRLLGQKLDMTTKLSRYKLSGVFRGRPSDIKMNIG